MDFGPSLPPNLKKKRKHMDMSEDDFDFESNSKRTENENEIGPRLPSHLLQDTGHDEDLFGPSLPSRSNTSLQLHKKKESCKLTTAVSGLDGNVIDGDKEMYGPIIPQNTKIRPSPPHLQCNSGKGDDSGVPQSSPIGPPYLKTVHSDSTLGGREIEEDDSYGPALPPGYMKSDSSAASATAVFSGPLLPPGMKGGCSNKWIGEEVDHPSDEDDYGNVIGPMPSSSSDAKMSLARTTADIEARAKATKDKMLGKNQPKQQRESWMTELPPELSKNFGLGPRKFRAKAADSGDRSIWSDSPAEKARKEAEGIEYRRKDAVEEETFKAPWQEAKDQEMERVIHSYTEKHRSESLLEQHQKKIKKQKKEEESKPPERRPFDRDIDLAGPGLSATQKKSLIKKSQELGSRFQRAKKGSSYL